MVLACRVLENLIEQRLADAGTPIIYMDYGLHVRPQGLAPALQEQLDALPGPRTVLVGYGLCGGGLAGLRAGPHTLIIPRVHDCIAILLGSHEAYAEAFRENPGTYYLTKGWLESGSHPLGHFQECTEQYGEETAGRVLDMMYRHYTRLCFVAVDPADLDAYAEEARKVADFCAERWGMTYDTCVGHDALIRSLLAAPDNPQAAGSDLVVVPPGGVVTQEMFLRA